MDFFQSGVQSHRTCTVKAQMQTEIELKCDYRNNEMTKQELGTLYAHSISMWEYFLAFELTIRSHTLHIGTARTRAVKMQRTENNLNFKLDNAAYSAQLCTAYAAEYA